MGVPAIMLFGRIMTSICANPYCPSPGGGMRPPTSKEMERFRDELDSGSLDRLNGHQITLQVCTTCGTWVVETWDGGRNTVVRQFVATPFKFNVGDPVKVLLEDKHCGMMGTITRRIRLSKTIMPPPPPENVYYLVFKDDSQEYGYSEANLALP